MSSRSRYQAIRGMRDILPPESAIWSGVEQTAREVFKSYGFGEIRTPVVEIAQLFERSIGDQTDVVTKELYGWIDSPKAMKALRRLRGEMKKSASKPSQSNSLSRAKLIALADGEAFDTLAEQDALVLRPEATASVCRAYIEHGMHVRPQPVKLYYMGPMFRRERPQKGRHRQFHQIGAEVLSQSDAAVIDAEVIEMLMVYFARLRLTGTILHVNSIGDKACRAIYIDALRSALREVKNDLDQDSQRRIETNPLRVLDSKSPREQAVIQGLPRITDYLCDACIRHFAELRRELDIRGIAYDIDWRLVRGLDYYTRTTFEITAPGLGSQNAVCGGGRYDGLVELLGGPPTKGFGFAIGTDRLVLCLEEIKSGSVTIDDDTLPEFSVALQRPDLVVTGTTENTWEAATQLAARLRQRGLFVYLPKPKTRLNQAFEAARKMGVRVAILVGEDESKRGTYGVRILAPLEEGGLRDLAMDEVDVVKYGKIVKLRQDLEKALISRLVGPTGRGERVSLQRLMGRLDGSGVLPSKLQYGLRDLVPILNGAIHGRERLGDASVEWALAFGNLLLNEIETLPLSGT